MERLEEGLRGAPDPARRERRRRRWDLAVFLAVLLGPAAWLATAVAVRQDVADLEERLVREANALVAASHPRPAHRGPQASGSFGDAVARHLPAFQAAAIVAKEDADGKALAQRIVAGESPFAMLPPRWRDALDRLGPDLDGLLAGTRAARADLPDAKEAGMPADGAGWDAYGHAVLLAGLRARQAVSRGDGRAAAETCLDGLALGRDAAFDAGLLGHMAAVQAIRRLVPPCAAAFDLLGPEARREALAAVRAIRDAIPPFRATLSDEVVLSQLAVGEALLSPAWRARLDRRVLLHLEAGERAGAVGLGGRLLLRDAWPATRSAQDALVAAAELPDAEREEAFLAISRRLERHVNVTAQLMPTESYLRYARRAEDGLRLLDALSLAVVAGIHRAERGAWPASVEGLAASGLLWPREAASGASHAPGVGGTFLEIVVPLLGSREDEAAFVTLRVRAQQPGRTGDDARPGPRRPPGRTGREPPPAR